MLEAALGDYKAVGKQKKSMSNVTSGRARTRRTDVDRRTCSPRTTCRKQSRRRRGGGRRGVVERESVGRRRRRRGRNVVDGKRRSGDNI